MAESKHRKATVIFLGLGTLFMVLLLVVLNAFKLNFLEPHDLVQIQLFTALSVLVFLLLVVLLVLLFRNILKHLADQRSRALGSRLRSRMLVGALLISCAPALFMVLFSYWLLNRSVDRWFTQPVSELRENSTQIALDLANYVSLNARAEAESLASSDDFVHNFQAADVASMMSNIRAHRTTLQGGFTVVYRDGAPLAQYQLPTPSKPVRVRPWLNNGPSMTPPQHEALAATVLHAAMRSDEPILTINDMQYALGDAALSSGGLVVMGLPLPSGLSATAQQIRTEANQYWALYRERRSLRTLFLLLLLLLTVLVFFSSSWLALYLSKQITRPVEALADAMDQIGEGRYGTRVTVSATEELGELIRSFNHMAGDLEQSRTLAETSAAQLSAANSNLEARRKELETVLETIPSSVVTLDHDGRILQANRAFLRLAGAPRFSTLTGLPLDSIFPPEISAELALLERRAQRMGLAATEIEMPSGSQSLHLSATIALLELGENRHGSILVIEDITELLRAQRQVTWKQVAQRVAHEIKNPLTPISLSAERIRRHMDNSRPESPGIIRRCTEVILLSVESMRELVDQFAALAEFPAARPKPENLNAILEGALMLFQGRLQGIRIEKHLAEDLPPVMVDPQAMQRALANLIDNAAEAMQSSLLRVLCIETNVSENRGMAEVVLSDTGHGLTDEMRERLFLPYVSTKQRGTGLGLAIAAKIVQEHGGAIRAETNSPAGARFIIELPLATNGHKHGDTPSGSHTPAQEAEPAR